MRAEVSPLTTKQIIVLACLVVLIAVAYFYSNPKPQGYYDYTTRIAGALLRGRTSIDVQPPSWLNELIPLGGRYYSAFPLGSVLTMLPVALLQAFGVIDSVPAGVVNAVIAGACTLFFFLLSLKYELSLAKRVMLVSLMLFGTWFWTNLAFGGAWQHALGFAVLGEVGALYFTLVKRRPLIAGFFFALAFGNRTELVLLAPIFVYLLQREAEVPPREMLKHWQPLARFALVPLLLGVATLAYNYARFSSPLDFGYARIPGVLDEPWYKYGIFSFHAIPLNAEKMLIELWKKINRYPYLTPSGFGGSIFLSCPFLFLVFRRNGRDNYLRIVSWIAIGVLTFVLWCHGNPGGWQYSYRYAMTLLPWVFLLLLQNRNQHVTPLEVVLFIVSIAVNAYATYLFFWTDYMKP